MSCITKLLIMWRFGLCLAGNNISIIQNATTWNEALGHCAVHNSRLADISDIEIYQNHENCNMILSTSKKKSFWTGNFYKLSNRISIKGCYLINDQTIAIEEGYKLLHDCFELCTGRMNESGFFAYRTVFLPNCICDLHLNNSLPENLKMAESYQCSNTDLFWWVYEVHINDFNTGNETCHQLTCTYSDVKYDNVCGQNSNKSKSSSQRTQIPLDKNPYICEMKVGKSASANETVVAGYFRFGLNASVNSDHIEKPAVAFKCKAISCNSDNTYKISLQNCSTTFGHICVKVTNNSHATRNTSQLIETSQPTSTISKYTSVSTKESHFHESTSTYTAASKLTTQSNFQRQTSGVLSHASPDNVDNSPVVRTPSTQSSVEGNSQTIRLDSTPSMINRSSYVSRNATDQNSYTTSSKITTQSTFQQRTNDVLSHSSPEKINNVQVVATSPVRTGAKKNSESIWRQITSSYTSSYGTVIKGREMLKSTTEVSETPSGSHSRIGLILGSLVAVVVVIVAVVLLVICRLRHHRPFMKKRFVDDSQINDSNFQDIDDTSDQSSRDVPNTMYDMHTVRADDTQFGLLDVTQDNSNIIRNNEYAVVVNNNRSGKQVLGHNFDTNGENSDNPLESEYNRLNHVRPRSGNNSNNIRNNEYAVVLKNNQSGNQVIEQNCSTNGENSDDMLESEYDRLNHVRPRSGNDLSNIYDSALAFRDDTDATYNTTVCRGIDKGDDSVYDHT